MGVPGDLDQFVRRLLFAYHGHPARSDDDRLHCSVCRTDFGTASMAEMVQATRRAAIAEALRRAAEACDAIGASGGGDTPYHDGARACAAAVRALDPLGVHVLADVRTAALPASLAEAEGQGRKLGKIIGMMCPDGWGFCLILFTFGPGGHMTYISNANRDDMVATLKELIAKMEAERYRE